MIALKDVLVATDFSPPSEAALAYGRALARAFGASLHLLHVAENPFLRATFGDRGEIEAAHRRWLEDRLTADDRKALNARALLVISDSAAAAIVDYAKRFAAGLIVMGTHGRNGVSQLLIGSVAERVVRTAPCPVLTLHHPEREFVIPDPPERRDDHDRAPENPRRN